MLKLAATFLAVTGEVPIRKNVNDLYAKGGPQWDLYLQALKALQAKRADDPLSYFQVMGIHGQPYIEWNKGGAHRARGDGWDGYCPHGENLFLPWHRPFVLLHEQLLVGEAVKIASKYPEKHRARYLQAAKTLRSPYWDWSLNSDVPPCTVPTTIAVNVPDGQGLKKQLIKNPLQSFDYPQAARDGQFGGFPNYQRTERCPAPQSYPQSANANLAQLGLKQSTVSSFCPCHAVFLPPFTGPGADGFGHASGLGVEQMHNSIHWDAGCGGQFVNPAVAGFDPIFMLHHTHVDRLWAYWNFINPSQSSFSDSYNGDARYSTEQNTLITPDSPLPPFYDANNTYYTPATVASIQGMGYTYEALEYWNKSPQQLQQDAIKLMNKLYGPSQLPGKRAATQDNTRYFARVELDREHVERPCSIRVFVGGKPAASAVVMQLPQTGIMHASVPVDEQMQHAFAQTPSSNGTMSSVEKLVEVEIRKVDGTVIPLSTVSSLKISLQKVAVTPAKSDTEFPTPGKVVKQRVRLRDRHRETKSTS
ncbi:hypothetical protein UVI_02016920 [Ustilaginoidea virens]|uniref:tyrosinase n=1 Tax=Ustilaginoidea virens TaxID=1159556 RepID=A0A1B5KYY4_USTVR|nr:hypothetical protein UVI_02016920 [Ustilaginoidea virens]